MSLMACRRHGPSASMTVMTNALGVCFGSLGSGFRARDGVLRVLGGDFGGFLARGGPFT